MGRTLLPLAACALLTTLWTLHRRPPAAFWKAPCPMRSLWNQDLLQEQQRRPRRHPPAWHPGPGVPPACGPDLDVAVRVADYHLLPQSMKDFLLYRHCRRYPLLLEPRDLCGPDGDPRLLLAIKSQASSFTRRQAIRQTWGGLGWAWDVGLVFLLGQEEEEGGGLSSLLACESRRFGDLLQWAFHDTFLNLTLKEVLFLPWLLHRCPSTRYIFKGDDDVFVNTPGLLAYLDSEQAQGLNLFLGDAIFRGRPCRNASLKYYVPGAFYSGLYPPYAGGAGVLYTGHLARQLEWASRALPLFPIDDVFTGMCLRSLGLVPTHHPGFRSFGINASERWEPCIYRRLFMVHRHSPQEMLLLWSLLQQQGNVSCG
ncbi:N-acetyllactosaminide beta-1,3-N-acetylglucosaminyltransferase 2 [Narcine bancroftii]|uniref:N-acetyllactosaminide beta-1,3-N-acetylglucosaminyltransferase 2 n=1 Tax=Narcine bancroftii TaxID=1343680 RepID=UPI00383172C0